MTEYPRKDISLRNTIPINTIPVSLGVVRALLRYIDPESCQTPGTHPEPEDGSSMPGSSPHRDQCSVGFRI